LKLVGRWNEAISEKAKGISALSWETAWGFVEGGKTVAMGLDLTKESWQGYEQGMPWFVTREKWRGERKHREGESFREVAGASSNSLSAKTPCESGKGNR